MKFLKILGVGFLLVTSAESFGLEGKHKVTASFTRLEVSISAKGSITLHSTGGGLNLGISRQLLQPEDGKKVNAYVFLNLDINHLGSYPLLVQANCTVDSNNMNNCAGEYFQLLENADLRWIIKRDGPQIRKYCTQLLNFQNVNRMDTVWDTTIKTYLIYQTRKTAKAPWEPHESSYSFTYQFGLTCTR